MLDMLKGVVGTVAKFAKGHPVLTGVSLAAMILPKLFGGSPAGMMGAQQSLGGQIPPGGVPPPMNGGSPGSW